MVVLQLFSAFDICGGCRKLNSSYDDDVGGVLASHSAENKRTAGPENRAAAVGSHHCFGAYCSHAAAPSPVSRPSRSSGKQLSPHGPHFV